MHVMYLTDLVERFSQILFNEDQSVQNVLDQKHWRRYSRERTVQRSYHISDICKSKDNNTKNVINHKNILCSSPLFLIRSPVTAVMLLSKVGSTRSTKERGPSTFGMKSSRLPLPRPRCEPGRGYRSPFSPHSVLPDVTRRSVLRSV